MSQQREQLEILKDLIACKLLEIKDKHKIETDLKSEMKRLKGGPMHEESKDTSGFLGISPASIFPPELWNVISHRLVNSADMAGMHETCRFFRTLLAPRRSLFLFREVLPLILPYVDTTTALNSRKVCKIWKTDFDEYIGDRFIKDLGPPVMSDLESILGTSHCVKSLESSNVFMNTVEEYLQPGRFLELMHQHSGDSGDSPFIGKGLELILYTETELGADFDSDNEEDNELQERERVFWTNLRLIFEKFGSYLHSIQIRISQNVVVVDAPNITQLLYHDLVYFFPNLKKLLFDGFLVRIPRNYVCPAHVNLPNITKLHVEIEEQEVFQQNNVMNFRARFRETLTTHFPSITNLLVTWEMWDKWGLSTLDWYGLHTLGLVNMNDSVKPEIIGNACLPNLKQLRMEPIIDDIWSDSFAFETMMSILASGLCSKSQLQTVRVRNGFPGGELLYAQPALCNDITNVIIQAVDGENDSGPGRYNFLLHFLSIKTLTIVWPRGESDEDVEGGSIVTVAESYSDHLEDVLDLNKVIADTKMAYKAAAWRLLPNLEVLYIQNDVYTRRKYENTVM